MTSPALFDPVRATDSRMPQRLGRDALPDIVMHLTALDDADRRMRFGRPMNDEALLRHAMALDFQRDALFGLFDASCRLAALAHVARGLHEAEVGLSVLPIARRQGLAQRLLSHAIGWARAQGARRLTMRCLGENAAMRRLAQRAGMEVRGDGADLEAALQMPDAMRGPECAAA